VKLYRYVDAATRPLMNRVYRIRHLDAERIPASGPVVLAANHESVLDPWFLGTVTPRPVHFLAKAELFRRPVLRQVLEGLGTIPVRRGTDMGRAVDAGVEALDAASWSDFPQATCLPYRNRRFHRGAARSRSRRAPRRPRALVGPSADPAADAPDRLPQVTIAVGELFTVERKPTRRGDRAHRPAERWTPSCKPYGRPTTPDRAVIESP
jgi:1-acyl-sn-glycerol-3-phosphate acyltransferase